MTRALRGGGDSRGRDGADASHKVVVAEPGELSTREATMPEEWTKQISPDMGLHEPESDPEGEALAWCGEEGLVWTEEAGWVVPGDAPDEHWDAVGWDVHPEHRSVASLRYWNDRDAQEGGWDLEHIPGRYRWHQWDIEESGEFPGDDDIAAFWVLVDIVDPYAQIDRLTIPDGIDVAAALQCVDRLIPTGAATVNGKPWRRTDDTWSPA